MFDRRGGRKYLNAVERRAFQQAVHGEQDTQWRAFGLTLILTGCRISEALHLTAERIDQAGKAVVFETLKRRSSGVFRSVPVPDELLALLRQITAELAPSSRVWPFSRATAYRWVKERMAQAGVVGGMASPKGLRHGFAVACVGQYIPLPTIKRWLGHARLETTAIYLAVSGEEERDLARRLWTNG